MNFLKILSWILLALFFFYLFIKKPKIPNGRNRWVIYDDNPKSWWFWAVLIFVLIIALTYIENRM